MYPTYWVAYTQSHPSRLNVQDLHIAQLDTTVTDIPPMAFEISCSRYPASEYSSSSNSVVEKNLASPAFPGSSETDEETPGTLEASAVARPFVHPCTDLHPHYLRDSGKEFSRRAGGSGACVQKDKFATHM